MKKFEWLLTWYKKSHTSMPHNKKLHHPFNGKILTKLKEKIKNLQIEKYD